MSKKYPSLVEIKRALPMHCFKPNLFWSLFYMARTLSIATCVALLFYIVHTQISNHIIITVIYAYVQGTVFWGIFVIGHDCGHGSFSSYYWVNWLIGNVLHSIILTPYESWRMSHHSHHKNTCNLEKDEIFYPYAPRAHSALTGITIGGAWFWYILFKNVPGRRNYFSYLNRDFASKWIPLGVSFFSLLCMCGLIYKLAKIIGWVLIFEYYFAPLFVFACWLVVVTFLHHNDETTPWYTNETWTIVKGSLSSIDRDYGLFVNTLSNNIHLHQLHHLFPIIPHYYLLDATIAFKTEFPHLVRKKNRFNAGRVF